MYDGEVWCSFLGWKFTTLGFLGQEICHIFYWINQCWGIYLSLVFFWVGNFDARYFLGVKFQAHVFWGVRNMKVPSDPPVMHTTSTPRGGYLTKLKTGKLRPEVQPLTLLYTILAEKVPLYMPFIEKKYPFHIPTVLWIKGATSRYFKAFLWRPKPRFKCWET